MFSLLRSVLPLFLSLLAASSLSRAEAPRTYSDPRTAIEAARKDEKLIVFFLADSFSKEAKAVEAAIGQQLEGHGHEFVVARCNAGSSAHRKMFAERFQKEVERAPVAVVSKSNGEEVTGCYGTKPKIYRKMIVLARIRAGLVKDKKEIARLKREIVEGEDPQLLADSLFGIKVEDLREQVEMTGVRTWTYAAGGKFRASLLEGRGETGIFVRESGERMEVKFAELSEEDKAYLGTVLRVEEKEKSKE